MTTVPRLRFAVDGGLAHVTFTSRADGDLNADLVPEPVLAARRRRLAPVAQTWLDEVHGTDVVVVDAAGDGDGTTADALVTAVADAGLGIWVGDCAPVALVSEQGVIGAAHAGWRGLVGGVLATTVEAMRQLGAKDIIGVLGPCIRAECYEFGAPDVDTVERTFGPRVRGRTAWGTDALDLPAAVRAALRALDVTLADLGVCTACDDDFWSFRARSEPGRHGMVVWMSAR